MLEPARKLSQVFLWQELNGKLPAPIEGLDSWFTQERQVHPQKFFPYLIEDPGKIETIFTLMPDPNDKDLVIMETISLDQFQPRPSEKLPFNMPSGSQSAALGPILKRTWSKDKGAGPSKKIIKTTLESFNTISSSNTPWAPYFKEMISILKRKKLKVGVSIFESSESDSILDIAVQKINASKTVFLTIIDTKGRYPGEVPEYIQYLQTILPESKYASLKTPKKTNQICPLCFSANTTIYPSACSGAGINISNVDRDGAFPSLNPDLAHHRYALCVDCADLLYIFKFYVMPKMITYIAGSKALVLPNLSAIAEHNIQIFYDVLIPKTRSKENTIETSNESLIIALLEAEKAITTIDIFWADFGQKLENIKGSITEILPSRLKKINDANKAFVDKIEENPFSPKRWMDNAQFELTLSITQFIFKRPGGKPAEKDNSAQVFWEFKNDLVSAIYKKQLFQRSRIMSQAYDVMKWHIKTALVQDNPSFYLTQEGFSIKKNKSWLTSAGWVRHFEVFLNYLETMEVLEKMENSRTYEPEWDALKPFFRTDSGIKSNEKAFAFLLGILYGILLIIQGARGVNVASNALTYIKNLNFSGQDLPELYIHVRKKLLDYESEKTSSIRQIIHELGTLGAKLGNQIQLDKITTCYFLLLGQSVAREIFKSEKEKN